MSLLLASLYASGSFAVLLGLLHFTFPERFGFFTVLPTEGAAVPPFRLLFYRYDMKCSDLRGIIYVMNHCVSYVILAAGVFDLFAAVVGHIFRRARGLPDRRILVRPIRHAIVPGPAQRGLVRDRLVRCPGCASSGRGVSVNALQTKCPTPASRKSAFFSSFPSIKARFSLFFSRPPLKVPGLSIELI